MSYLRLVQDLRELLGQVHMVSWYGISADRERKIRAEVAKDLREKLEKELRPVLRGQVEKELWDKAHQQALLEIQTAQETEKPTPRERKAFQEFVREVELDAHAQATVASLEADKDDRRLHWSRRIMNTGTHLLSFVALPLLYTAFHRFGLSIEFAVSAATMAIVLITLMATNSKRHERLSSAIKRNRRISSDYMLIAEDAKVLRLVRAERLDTKRQLDDFVANLAQKKSRLDTEHHPRTEDLHQARDSVRVRIDTGTPFQDIDDFEERLAEAEAEAAGEAERVAR